MIAAIGGIGIVEEMDICIRGMGDSQAASHHPPSRSAKSGPSRLRPCLASREMCTYRR
jgi:hypothetical protein